MIELPAVEMIDLVEHVGAARAFGGRGFVLGDAGRARAARPRGCLLRPSPPHRARRPAAGSR